MVKATLKKVSLMSGLLCLFGFSSHGHSAVYKCQVKGKTVYQSTTCFNGKQTVLHPSKHDTGLHASWFARPKMLPDSARCQPAQCQCGEQTLPLGQNQTENVAASLNAIITDWQRHQNAYLSYQALSDEDKFTSPLQDQVATSACSIAMHQAVLNQAYLSVLNDDLKPALTDVQQQEIKAKCESESLENSSDEADTRLQACITRAQDEASNNAQARDERIAQAKAKFAKPVAVLKQKNPYFSE